MILYLLYTGPTITYGFLKALNSTYSSSQLLVSTGMEVTSVPLSLSPTQDNRALTIASGLSHV